MASADVGRPNLAEFSAVSTNVNNHVTILLVEDEQFLRTVIQRVLSDAGYEVITASDAREALDQFCSCKGQVDLLIADVILPGRNGARLAAELMQKRPGLRTVMISGYPERLVRNCQRHAAANVFYLPKPFTTEVLTRKVHDVLSSELQARLR
jgi:two-component system cell cycle sensor histidine kinase/response regulator CckA